MQVKIKKLHPNAVIPEQGTNLAGGWDVTVTEIENEGNLVICRLGFSTSIPDGYKMRIVPRSSLTKTNWYIPNSPAIIDSDYRGEWQVRFRCMPTSIHEPIGCSVLLYDEFPFKVGDRIAQIYLEEVIPIEWEEVEKLDETGRGDGGFGSTGA